MKINLNNVSEIVVDLNKLTNDEIDKFSELIEKAERKGQKPTVGDEYWSIDADGDTIWNYVWHNNDLDEQHYSIGNCFRTRENAVDAIQRLKIIAGLQHYADEHNDTDIDMTNTWQIKYFIYYDYINNCINYYKVHSSNMLQIYFTSLGIAQDAVKAVGEERIKKYLFGVES